MYNVKSKQAEEFIDHQEILDTLDYALSNKNNRALIESLIEKAALCKGLSHREAALLLECNLPSGTGNQTKILWQPHRDVRTAIPFQLLRKRLCLLPLSCQKPYDSTQETVTGRDTSRSHCLAGHGT